jgi:hypothetical protein
MAAIPPGTILPGHNEPFLTYPSRHETLELAIQLPDHSRHWKRIIPETTGYAKTQDVRQQDH